MAQTVTPILPHYEYYLPSDYTYPKSNATVETFQSQTVICNESDNGQFVCDNIFFVEECYDSIKQSNLQCHTMDNDVYVCEDSQATPVYSSHIKSDIGFGDNQVSFIICPVEEKQPPIQSEIIHNNFLHSSRPNMIEPVKKRSAVV